MNKTVATILLFGVLCFGLIFYIFYSELAGRQETTKVQKQQLQKEDQQREYNLNIVDIKKLNSDHSNAKVIYDEPYPVGWEQDGVRINLKGVYHGMIEAPTGLARDDGNGDYVGEEKVHAILLNLQVVADEDATSKCVEIPAKLININDQRVKSANTKQFYFPGTEGCGVEPNRTYENQQIIFVVEPTTTQFVLLPLGNTEKIYQIFVQGNFMQFDEESSLEAAGVFDSGLLDIFSPKKVREISTKGASPYLKVTAPTTKVRIPRGENINIQWDAYNIDANSRIIIRLKNGNLDYVPSKVYEASDLRGNIVATMPRGTYTLEIEYDGELAYSGEVDIISGEQEVSTRQSVFAFTDRDSINTLGTIGDSSAHVLVRLIDDYSYPIVGRNVKLVSSRPNKDEIVATAKRTNKNGEVEFLVTSEEKGISQLYLEIEGQRWEESLLLNVLEGEKCDCDCDCEEEE